MVDLSPSRLADRSSVLEVGGRPGAGVTSVLLAFLAPASVEGPAAYLDVRGMVSPVAAADAGCRLDRLAFVRTAQVDGWAKALGYLLDGVQVVAAEAPRGVPAAVLRALVGRARARRRALILHPLGWSLPAGLTAGRLDVISSHWEGHERHIKARVDGKLANGTAVEGELALPSLVLSPELPARRLVAVQ